MLGHSRIGICKSPIGGAGTWRTIRVCGNQARNVPAFIAAQLLGAIRHGAFPVAAPAARGRGHRLDAAFEEGDSGVARRGTGPSTVPSSRRTRRFGSRRETVRSATSMPSLRSSTWILGAPHRGWAAAILLTRFLIAASTRGRPAGGGGRRAWPSGGESGVAASAARATMTTACLRAGHTLDSQTQRSRSLR